jgi:hypothetical protein
MSSFIYDTVFNRLEKARWNLNEDIPWDSIDKSTQPEKYLQQVKVIALAEFTSLDATMMFLRDYFNDLDFSCFMSIWYYEEMKHHYVLKRYLQAYGVEISPEELRPLHQSLPPGGPIQTLTMHLVGEIKLHNWYKAVAEISPEPVSIKIFDLMAVDELRHGQVYYEFLEREIQKDPAALGTILRMARFMFKEEKGNVKHPVPQLVEGSAEFNFNEALSDIFSTWADQIRVANEKAERMTFRFLSKLAGQKITNEEDLSRVIKEERKRVLSGAARGVYEDNITA